ncbi:MAG: disulfide bond formation protein B [Gammaproteobacteria bacterium]|nr:disulfide bond formation protein B [Gammaproteobacteria bacterium]
MFNKLLEISQSKYYWLGLMVFAVGLELSALFYQYVLDYLPCVLCIHVRIWVFAIVVVAAISLGLLKSISLQIVSQLMMTVISLGLFERSYQLLGTERGFVFGDCNMESGLPFWFAVDKWLPAVFEVQAACGYTPELFFTITMSEALITLSVLLLLLSVTMLVALIVARYFKGLLQ